MYFCVAYYWRLSRAVIPFQYRYVIIIVLWPTERCSFTSLAGIDVTITREADAYRHALCIVRGGSYTALPLPTPPPVLFVEFNHVQ